MKVNFELGFCSKEKQLSFKRLLRLPSEWFLSTNLGSWDLVGWSVGFLIVNVVKENLFVSTQFLSHLPAAD